MKIFSFASQQQASLPVRRPHYAGRSDNAAPVAPQNPFAVFTTTAPRLQTLERDTFNGFSSQAEAQRKPVVASFAASHDWIYKHSAEQLRSRLDEHIADGSFDDLSQAAGLLNVASKTNRLAFAGTDTARFEFSRHFGEAVDALKMDDPYAARLSLQRAMRCVDGFQNLKNV